MTERLYRPGMVPQRAPAECMNARPNFGLGDPTLDRQRPYETWNPTAMTRCGGRSGAVLPRAASGALVRPNASLRRLPAGGISPARPSADCGARSG